MLIIEVTNISPKKRAPRNAKNRRGSLDNLPVKVGEEYEVDIVDITPNGEGIAKINHFSIFIPNVKLNEHVRIKVTRLDSAAADAQKIF